MRQNIIKSNMKKYQDCVRLAYNVVEVSEAIGVSVQKVDDFIRNGDLAYFRVGTQILVSYEALLRFIKQRTQRPIQISWMVDP